MKIELFLRRSWVKIPVFVVCNMFIIAVISVVLQGVCLLLGHNFLELLNLNPWLLVLFVFVVGCYSVIHSLLLYLKITDWAKRMDHKRIKY